MFLIVVGLGFCYVFMFQVLIVRGEKFKVLVGGSGSCYLIVIGLLEGCWIVLGSLSFKVGFIFWKFDFNVLLCFRGKVDIFYYVINVIIWFIY